MISFYLEIFPDVELPDDMIILFLSFEALPTVFHSCRTELKSHPQCTKGTVQHADSKLLYEIKENH